MAKKEYELLIKPLPVKQDPEGQYTYWCSIIVGAMYGYITI